jgi:hypothetical protein
MPVEIKELVIRAVVVKSTDEAKAHVSRAAKAAATRNIGSDQDALVDECVAEVMRLLRRSKER